MIIFTPYNLNLIANITSKRTFGKAQSLSQNSWIVNFSPKTLTSGAFHYANRPVRDQWEYTRKMDDIFRSHRVNQKEWVLPFFIPFSNFLRKWREVGQWTGLSKWNGKLRSDRPKWTTSRRVPECSSKSFAVQRFEFDRNDTIVGRSFHSSRVNRGRFQQRKRRAIRASNLALLKRFPWERADLSNF